MSTVAATPFPTLKTSLMVRVILAFAGFSFIAVGSAILFAPHPFYASTDVDLVENPTLLSDIHGLGALILSSGILIALGAFVHRLAFMSALVGAVVYLSYVAARLLSLAVDGRPGPSVLGALAAELVLGLGCLFALVRYRD
jgi:hypothetical protein